MIQLRVYNNGSQFWLDLYPESPIKLTLSVEDIVDTEATSTFSRTFRVPNTKNNYYFFSTAFMVDGIDYDVTVKKSAEILVDGQPFKQGHVRLQKIFNNEDFNKVDYEIVFLGETRDFASALGDKPLCQLPLDLVHSLTKNNIETSWQAYPQGSPTSGLFNGDVLYPLIDHGNTYTSGVPNEAEIKSNPGTHSKAFTQNSHPIFPNRFKPMIRAKAIIDAIFSQTPYTFESNFLDSFKFKKIYVSAFGNDNSVFTNVTATDNLFEGESSTIVNVNQGGVFTVPIDTIFNDPAGNFNSTTFTYTVAAEGSYTFSGQALVSIISSPGTAAFATAELWVNNVLRATGSSAQFGVSLFVTTDLDIGDTVQFRVRFSPTTSSAFIDSVASISVIAAPGVFNPTANLDCEYKQIDFMKDILTVFRLVMAPVKDDPFKFKIEPWNDYIAKGDIYDWTNKLDRNRDIQLEPLFFTQSDRIEFTFSEDEDYLNKYTQDAFKETYGQLNFDSNSELLKGTRNIEVGFAPTPITQILGEPATSAWVIPQINTLESDSGSTLHEPIRAKTRILFYTGLKPLPASKNWYFREGANTVSYTNYPLVHYQESWAPQANDLNLNWARWFGYYNQDNQLVGFDPFAGQSLYEAFWSNYIASLYNKFSRRLTGTFILDHLDLVDLTFDDIIFVDGTYYRPEKIIDAPVGEKGPVKVQLIKLNNFRQSDQVIPEEFYYYEITATDCISNEPTFFILQSPVPLQIGDIISVVGSTQCYQIINASASQIYDFVLAQTWGTCEDCINNNQETNIYIANKWTNDCLQIEETSIIVNYVGTLNTDDTVTLQNTPGCWYISGISQLAPQDTVIATSPDCFTCNNIPPLAEYYYLGQPCSDSGTLYPIVSNDPNLSSSVVTLPGVIGCIEVQNIIGVTGGALTPTNVYATCIECEQINPTNYVLESCGPDVITGQVVNIIANNANNCNVNEPVQTFEWQLNNLLWEVEDRVWSFAVVVGQTVQLSGIPGCWTVLGLTSDPATATINCTPSGSDCFDCTNNFAITYRAINCTTGSTLYVQSAAPLIIGNVVNVDTFIGCWEIVEQDNTFQPEASVIGVHSNCNVCNQQL